MVELKLAEELAHSIQLVGLFGLLHDTRSQRLPGTLHHKDVLLVLHLTKNDVYQVSVFLLHEFDLISELRKINLSDLLTRHQSL